MPYTRVPPCLGVPATILDVVKSKIESNEINLNISPSKDNIKNYGYPIASYGEHYGFPDKSVDYLYKLA